MPDDNKATRISEIKAEMAAIQARGTELGVKLAAASEGNDRHSLETKARQNAKAITSLAMELSRLGDV